MFEEAEENDPVEETYHRVLKQRMLIVTAFMLILLVVAALRPGSGGGNPLSFENKMIHLNLPDGTSYAVPFEEVSDIHLVEHPVLGECISGKKEKRSAYGVWQNEALGEYILFANGTLDTVIQLDSTTRTYWVSYESDNTTRLLCENIRQEVMGK